MRCDAGILEKSMTSLGCCGDVVGLGQPSDNFQPITRFVSIALLGNEIVVSVTLLGYDWKHVTRCL